MSSHGLAHQGSNSPLIVSGHALVTDGDTEAAIVRAILDALRTAATQHKGKIISHSIVNAEGQLTENISLQANLNIHHMDLLEQNAEHGIATVKLALELDERAKNCQLPQLTQVMTTALATPPDNSSYHQVDVNQLLLEAEAQFSALAESVNFATHRINPALNAYQTAWLASEAYNQADYHLAIGAQWLQHPLNKTESKGLNRPTLILTADFSSPYLPHINLHHQQRFTLPANQSIAESSGSIPQELSQDVATWVENSWRSVYQNVQCEGSYVKLSKIIDQPLWRINKGQILGLEQGQQLLLLPQNYRDGILNPDAVILGQQ